MSRHLKTVFLVSVFFSLAPAGAALAQVAADADEFQQLVAALQADDSERQTAIAVCIAQGIGDNPTGAAQFMGVPVAQAAEAWCTRMTNGIVSGKLTLADVNGLNEGSISPAAQAVLTTVSEGK